MKYIAAIALSLTISGTPSANAGSLSDPILAQEIIIEDAKAGSSSSAMVLVALTGLLMFAVIAQ